MRKELRVYQAEAIADCRRLIKEGKKRVIVHLPTGAGKGVILVEVALNAIEKGNRVLFIVKGRQLVFQTEKLFLNAGLEKEKIKILMGSHTTDNEGALVIASVDTVARRKSKINAAVVIVDEMHLSTSPTYQRVFESLGDVIFIGLSATPYHIGNKGHTFWNGYTQPATPRQLLEASFLTATKVYARRPVNTKGIKTVAGDFHTGELEKESNKIMATFF